MNKVGIIFSALLLATIFAANAAASEKQVPGQDGPVERTVLKALIIDSGMGEALIGAALVVDGTTVGAVTDIDGVCEIPLDQGEYYMTASYMGYLTVTFAVKADRRDIVLGTVYGPDGSPLAPASAPCQPSVTLSPEGVIVIALAEDENLLQNAVVTGRKNMESLRSLQQERINSAFAIENMGANEMKLKGISNAQESVTKLSGISVADAGELIVRGLGDRYSTTTLNGLPIASPNPDNKLIPLDVFPASTISNVTVSKVYEASSFADYSGAHVDISTREGDQNFFTVGFSTGGYFSTIFRDFGRMDGPSLFASPRINATADNIAYSEFDSFIRNNDVFRTSFDSRYVTALPDLNGNIGLGRSFNVGRQKLDILASVSIKSSDESARDSFYRTYEASSSGNMTSEYLYDSYTRKLDIAGLLDVRQSLRQNDFLHFTAFYARNAKNTFMDRSGYDFIETYDLVGRNSVTHIYALQNYQLAGHHETDSGSWLFDWAMSAGFTSSDEPDRRQVMFRRNEDTGNLGFFKLNAQETQRYFGTLQENEYVAGGKVSHDFNENNSLRFGVTGKYKTRNFDVTRFYYDVDRIDDVITDLGSLEQYLGYEAIHSGLISVDRNKQRRNHYDAFNAIAAAYAEGDFRFGERWFLNAGLRFEASRQSVSYTTDYNVGMTRNLDAFDFFPAINFKYSLDSQNAFRLSLSRTITRPSFVEMAPFLYQETFGGAQIRGNEDLQNGYNYNVDLKYEFFRENSTDMLGVTAYYKFLDSPIERTQRLSGGAVEHSFSNADKGSAAGVEVEIRKNIVKDLTFSANASYMFTNVILPSGSYTNSERPLQGASPYIVNADLTYTPSLRNGQTFTLALLYNLLGPRIHAVGMLGLGDVKQLAFHTLDLNASWNFTPRWSISLGFRNILNQTARYRQDIPNASRTVEVEQWHTGPGFDIGISYSIR